MQIIAPDILTEVSALSPALSGTAAAVGLLLWAFGWRWHRFWLVAGITAGAGMLGLTAAPTAGENLLVVALLLAVAAGTLALELSRLLAFAAGGMALWFGVRAILPSAQEMTVVFLLGGLGGVLLYRFWVMLLTSFLGTVLFWYAGLGLLGRLAKFDAVGWAEKNVLLLNGAILGAIALGVLAQVVVERRFAKGGGGKAKEEPKAEKKPKPAPAADESANWWPWLKLKRNKAA